MTTTDVDIGLELLEFIDLEQLPQYIDLQLQLQLQEEEDVFTIAGMERVENTLITLLTSGSSTETSTSQSTLSTSHSTRLSRSTNSSTTAARLKLAMPRSPVSLRSTGKVEI